MVYLGKTAFLYSYAYELCSLVLWLCPNLFLCYHKTNLEYGSPEKDRGKLTLKIFVSGVACSKLKKSNGEMEKK